MVNDVDDVMFVIGVVAFTVNGDADDVMGDNDDVTFVDDDVPNDVVCLGYTVVGLKVIGFPVNPRCEVLPKTEYEELFQLYAFVVENEFCLFAIAFTVVGSCWAEENRVPAFRRYLSLTVVVFVADVVVVDALVVSADSGVGVVSFCFVVTLINLTSK